MGSAYPTIAADVLARFQRMSGRTVRFLTGTDEHGEKIALAAAARGMSPREHCDAIAREYQELWAKLDISYDGFVRTTDAHHEELVAEVLQRVWDKGDIYKAAYSGWYCVDCEEYKDEKEMDGEHTCPTHRKPCQHREEENYFFALSKYQDRLQELIDGTDFVQPASRRNEVLGWVKEGVRDFSISRSNVDWGIRVPQDPQHTVYVWFDALNGYLSGLLPLAGRSGSGDGEGGVEGGSLSALPSAGWPADVHVIGKDILRFHAIYWPAMLMSAGLPVPKQVFGHGFLTKDGLKMGKSLGNTLDPDALVTGYGPDAVRYYFMRKVLFGQDGNFSEEAFRDTLNADLANTVGNMLNRTLGLLHKYCDGKLPASADEAAPAVAQGDGDQREHPLRAAAAEGAARAAAAYGGMAPHLALDAAVAVAVRGNLFLEETAPWTALKKGTDDEKAAAARGLVAVLETARIVALLLAPVTPRVSDKMLSQLGLGEGGAAGASWSDTAWGALQGGHQTPAPGPVFARIDDTVPYATEPANGAPPAGKAAGDKGGAKQGGAKQQKQKQQKQQQKEPQPQEA